MQLLFSLCVALCTLSTQHTEISINDKGYYASIKVDGTEILAQGAYPIATVCAGGALLFPQQLTYRQGLLRLTYPNGANLVLEAREYPYSVVLTVKEADPSFDAIVFGPVGLSISQTVGDIIGVVQGGNVAYGFQALNPKTMAGLPLEYAPQLMAHFGYEGEGAQLSVGTVPAFRLAATRTPQGAILQCMAERRNTVRYRTVQQVPNALVLPVEGPDGTLEGASVALFGSPRAEALTRIGQIELEQGLPHPLFEGEWGKTARQSMASYLISNFSEDDLDFVLEKAQRAGFGTIYHSDPFETWGHFTWSPFFTKRGDEGVKDMVDRAAAVGIAVGVHTLSNFTTPNDAYVTPVPSAHLLKQGVLQLSAPLTTETTEMEVTASQPGLFDVVMTLNALQIENELITYSQAVPIPQTTPDTPQSFRLEGCQRGAFGTTPATHTKDQPLYKLWDYPYRTLFPDLTLQDAFADRLVALFNKTGLRQISFDGLEGCTYTGHGDYATARFVTRWYNGLDHNVLNDASNLNHFTWHINTRMNWGEPWGEAMRTGQVENRIKNQDFFARNLFPRMLGWFLIRLADKNFEATSMEDLEWALSESVGFDAGYAMSINMKTLRGHGQMDALLDAIRTWDALRASQKVSDTLRAQLRDPATEWHLERNGDTFTLYPLYISKTFTCSLGELQPGQPGGADWVWKTPEAGPFSLRLRVEGDGSISNPSFATTGGTLVFPCTLSDGQYLLYDGRQAVVTDKNYNVLTTVTPQGKAALPAGTSAVQFSCRRAPDDTPDVHIRYSTQQHPLTISL